MNGITTFNALNFMNINLDVYKQSSSFVTRMKQ
jgi:hypothetical protein